MSRIPISALGFLSAKGAAGSPMVQWVLHRCGRFHGSLGAICGVAPWLYWEGVEKEFVHVDKFFGKG